MNFSRERTLQEFFQEVDKLTSDSGRKSARRRRRRTTTTTTTVSQLQFLSHFLFRDVVSPSHLTGVFDFGPLLAGRSAPAASESTDEGSLGIQLDVGKMMEDVYRCLLSVALWEFTDFLGAKILRFPYMISFFGSQSLLNPFFFRIFPSVNSWWH